MLFTSIDYLIFFPLVLLFYFLIPKRFRYIWLLVVSYYFYMCWNAPYALLMLTSTLTTFASGLLIEKCQKMERPGLAKLCVALSFLINLCILFFFKYANFFIESLNAVLSTLSMNGQAGYINVLLPVGISFYTFQALSYTMDVYRKDVPAERNVFYYALFVSFFPQLVAGPIERTGTLLPQLKKPQDFNVQNARRGLLLIAWGLFIKLALADNLAPIVTMVYANYADYTGLEIALATFAFSFQIYGDFAGYSYIAIGSAAVLGIRLMENFRAPYLGVSVADFWRRWHISLTTWFKDCLYIPLGGNRKGTARKHMNILIVFLVSGFWHGANWTFVVWGLLNGLLLVLGEITTGLRQRTRAGLRVNTEAASYTFYRRLMTFLLINLTWIFFRADTLTSAWQMLLRVFTDFQLPKLFSPALFDLFFDAQSAILVLGFVLLLMLVDAAKNRGTSVDGWVLSQGAALRWGIYLGLMFTIILFGAYGNTSTQTQFIYFQF